MRSQKRFHLKALHGSVSFDYFEKLVHSKTVKVRVGDIVFELKADARNALRDMLKAVQG